MSKQLKEVKHENSVKRSNDNTKIANKQTRTVIAETIKHQISHAKSSQ